MSSDNESNDESKVEPLRVRYGNRIYRATRLSSGNWSVADQNGFHFKTVNHNDFQAQFEKVPDDNKTGPES